jgi:serine/threonine protein kinase
VSEVIWYSDNSFLYFLQILNIRIDICIGISPSSLFLHCKCLADKDMVAHGILKPSNVLLDEDLGPIGNQIQQWSNFIIVTLREREKEIKR